MKKLFDWVSGVWGRSSELPPREKSEEHWVELLRTGDFVAAVPALHKAIRGEDAHAMRALGELLALGKGIEKAPESAASWFRQAAVRGDVIGQSSFGICLATGFGIAQDETEPAYWLYRAGKAGNQKAIEALQQVTLRNRATVGPHFSARDLYVLLRESKRPQIGKATVQ